APTSEGFSRSDQGSHSGARIASSPGSSAVSATVAALAREARTSTTTQDQPRYPGMVQSKMWVTSRSPLASTRRCSPTWPGSVTSSSASRASSMASAAIASSLGREVRARRGAVVDDVMESGLEVVGDGTENGGDLLRVASIGVAALAQAVRGVVEQTDQSLDHARHLVGLLAPGAADRGSRFEQLQGEDLGAAAAVDHVEVHPGPRAEGRDPVGQVRGMHVDALTVLVIEDEAEALLGVVELHLAAWHLDPIPCLLLIGLRVLVPRGAGGASVPVAPHPPRGAAGDRPATLESIVPAPPHGELIPRA